MIDIGTYGLHVVHGAFNYGIESADWRIKGILEGSHQLLHDTLVHWADYVSVTQSSEYPLFFYATRWVKINRFQIHFCAYGQIFLK